MRRMTETDGRSFLAKGTHVGVFATTRSDGRPHATPVWYAPDGGDYVFTSDQGTIKVRNLRANPNMCLVVQDEHPPFDYVTVEGVAEVIDDLAECRRISRILGAKYMGEDRADEFAKRNGVPGELVVRIHPSAFFGFLGVAE